MITFHNTLTINRPIEDVFAALTDLSRIPDWNYYVREVVQLTSGPLRPGSVFHQIRHHDQQRFQILHLDPPRQLVLETLPGEQPAFHRNLTLEPDTSGHEGQITTKLTDQWQLDTGGASLAQRLGRLAISRAVNDNLNKLAELLETGTTRLQDGRTIQGASRPSLNQPLTHRPPHVEQRRCAVRGLSGSAHTTARRTAADGDHGCTPQGLPGGSSCRLRSPEAALQLPDQWSWK